MITTRYPYQGETGPPFVPGLPHTVARSRRFGDHLRTLDWSVGEIVGAVDAAGLGESTLIMFSADNGPVSPQIAASRPVQAHS